MIANMTAARSAVGRQTRTGPVVAIVVTIVCACVTLLVLSSAVYAAVFFAADHELSGSALMAVGWLLALGTISGLATAYLGRRGVQELRARWMRLSAASPASGPGGVQPSR